MAKKEKVLYVDMDNVLVDFQSGIDALAPEDKEGRIRGRMIIARISFQKWSR